MIVLIFQRTCLALNLLLLLKLKCQYANDLGILISCKDFQPSVSCMYYITATAPGAKLAHGAVVCSVCCVRLQGLATWREGGSWAGVGSHKVETHKNLNFTRHTVMTAVAADTDWIFR